ncbi:MAG: hypothetical protein FWB97_08665 [Oscillospiraceae bacterium]|nr:hypothetical protein [Oscillospiraceae bacterium]
MVEYFNFYYFLYIALALAMLLGLYFLLKGKSESTSKIVLLGILLASFLLHFFKLAFDFYQEWMPIAIRTITPENICAVSVLVYPWFFLSKKPLLKDYMFYFGIMSGIGATLIPIDVIGRSAADFETIRFYISHITLWVVPLLMVLLKLHTLDYKRIIKVPFLVYLILCVILANEVFLIGAGFVHIDHLFSNEIRNHTLIFGPLAEVGFLGAFFNALTPELFRTVPIGPNAGYVFYWPIIWLIIPSFIYFSIASFFMALPFDYRRVKSDTLLLLSKIKTRTFAGGAGSG